MKRIVVFGPGPQFKGGLANYNTSLAKAFDKIEETEVHIVSWTQQYPSIIPRDYMDRKSKKDQLEGTNIKVHYVTNYNNPSTWNKTVRLIKSINPEKVIFQWSIAIQGLPLGYIARKLKSRTQVKVFFDLHFVIQKEGSIIDKRFTNYGIKRADAYIAHSYKTGRELETLYPEKKFFYIESLNQTHAEYLKDEDGRTNANKSEIPIIKLYHPVYDMFTPNPEFDVDAHKNSLGLNRYVFLFFGFIRKYKGLHNAIQAFAEMAKKRDDISLLIVGESFWNTLDKKKLSTKIKKSLFNIAKSLFLKKQDDEKDYRPLDLIPELGIEDKTTIINEFVPNEEVNKYFQVSDAIVLYYLTATPSGVESMAYNFDLPILATKVGHFPETIKDGYNGYLAEPDSIHSMAEAMEKIITHPIEKANVAESSKNMSWENYARALL